MQRRLPILQAAQVGVSPSLEEHAAIWVVAFDHSVAQQEAILDVNVSVVVQKDFHAAGALPDNGQLKWGGAFITERIHLSLELKQELDKRVPAVVCCHMEGSPAVIALGIDNVTSVIRLQHQACNPSPAMHGGVMQGCEATN